MYQPRECTIKVIRDTRESRYEPNISLLSFSTGSDPLVILRCIHEHGCTRICVYIHVPHGITPGGDAIKVNLNVEMQTRIRVYTYTLIHKCVYSVYVEVLLHH